METGEFRDWLRAETLAAGFARAGFASCEPFAAEKERLGAWFAAGGGRASGKLKFSDLTRKNCFPRFHDAFLSF